MLPGSMSLHYTVVINNYNYEPYLRECIQSVLDQTHPADEILFVDDGSTDRSVDFVRETFGDKVQIIAKPNGGQLSAFVAGIEATTGDIICFLDADDTYKPDYLEEIDRLRTAKPELEVVFCQQENVGVGNNLKDSDVPEIWCYPNTDYDYGISAALSYCIAHERSSCFLGNVTSCISLPLALARRLRLKEFSLLNDYKYQADYVLLFAASYLGGRKYYFSKALVNYRIHGKNLWAATERSEQQKAADAHFHRAVLEFYDEVLASQPALPGALRKEMRTVPELLPEHRRIYKKYWYSLRFSNGRWVMRKRFSQTWIAKTWKKWVRSLSLKKVLE